MRFSAGLFNHFVHISSSTAVDLNDFVLITHNRPRVTILELIARIANQINFQST